jgi:hypothetical protein
MENLFPLTECVTDENLLHFCLQHVSERGKDNSPHKVAEQIIVNYIINGFFKEGKETFTNDDINDKFAELMVSHLVEELYNKGMVETSFDDDGETLIQITENGKQYLDERKESNDGS